MQGQSHHVQSVQEKVTPNVMPEKVKVKENLSVKPVIKVLSEPAKPVKQRIVPVQKTPVPFKTHMELLLEKTDPVEEDRKRASSMAILQKNIAEREAKLRALDNQ